MIRFVDLTDYYWNVERSELSPGESQKDFCPPVCAFVGTIDNRFVESGCGHLFFSQDDIDLHPMAGRISRLVPEGFFKCDQSIIKEEPQE